MRRSGFLLLIGLTGCMVGPDYHRPEIAMPLKFVEAREEEEGDLRRWWEQFEDPFLNRLIEEAYAANFDVRIAMEQILEARANYRVQRSQLWPEIDLNATAIRSRSSQNVFGSTTSAVGGGVDTVSTSVAGFGFIGPPVQNLFQVGFDAIWELDFFGKFRRAKRAALFEWEASRDAAQNVLIIALSEVARNYVAICALQKKMEIIEEKIWADEELLRLVRELFDAGLSSEIQVEDLVATLESDRALLPLLEASFKQTVYSLAVLLGRQPEGLLEEFVEVRPIPSAWDKIPVGLPSDLLRRRPDVRQAERQLAAATERIGVAVADLFPHISLTGTSGGYEAMKLNKWFKPPSRYWTIGPSINWDVLDFGKTRGVIDGFKSLQRQAFLVYEKAVVSSLQDVEGALAAYFEEEARQASIQEEYAANGRAFALTEDLFEAGLSSDLQVLRSLRVLLDAENTLVDSQQALTRDLIAVYKALGGDWECSYSP